MMDLIEGIQSSLFSTDSMGSFALAVVLSAAIGLAAIVAGFWLFTRLFMLVCAGIGVAIGMTLRGLFTLVGLLFELAQRPFVAEDRTLTPALTGVDLPLGYEAGGWPAFSGGRPPIRMRDSGHIAPLRRTVGGA